MTMIHLRVRRVKGITAHRRVNPPNHAEWQIESKTCVKSLAPYELIMSCRKLDDNFGFT